MRIHDLAGKHICILGYGKEGRAVFQALQAKAPGAIVTVADKAETIELPSGAKTQLGEGYIKNLNHFDVIIKSPGVPFHPEFSEITGVMTTSTQLFFAEAQAAGSTIIGVTGSKGKSTTSTLIAEILRAAKMPVLLVGNIGEPAIAHIDELKRETVVVMELSSYQLMDLSVSPSVAVVTSFFPEHLDYHGSEEAYMEAKKHITRFQNAHDVVFYRTVSDGARLIALESPGSKIPFSPEECPVPMTETRLLGEHNRGNIAGAFKVAMHMGVSPEVAKQVIREFHGLPHRLQSLGVKDGIEWVDDAISTTPESTVAALNALGDRVATLILGGQDRGYDFWVLADRIRSSSVQHIILFPGSGPRIKKAIEECGAAVSFHDADSMEKAVQIARSHTEQGKIALLSTASPSYGMFKNFEEKGAKFAEQILRAEGQ